MMNFIKGADYPKKRELEKFYAYHINSRKQEKDASEEQSQRTSLDNAMLAIHGFMEENFSLKTGQRDVESSTTKHRRQQSPAIKPLPKPLRPQQPPKKFDKPIAKKERLTRLEKRLDSSTSSTFELNHGLFEEVYEMDNATFNKKIPEMLNLDDLETIKKMENIISSKEPSHYWKRKFAGLNAIYETNLTPNKNNFGSLKKTITDYQLNVLLASIHHINDKKNVHIAFSTKEFLRAYYKIFRYPSVLVETNNVVQILLSEEAGENTAFKKLILDKPKNVYKNGVRSPYADIIGTDGSKLDYFLELKEKKKVDIDGSMSNHLFDYVLNLNPEQLNSNISSLLIPEDLLFVNSYIYERDGNYFKLNKKNPTHHIPQFYPANSARFSKKMEEVKTRYYYQQGAVGSTSIITYVSDGQIGAFIGALVNINEGTTKKLNNDVKEILKKYYDIINSSRSEDNNQNIPNEYFTNIDPTVIAYLRENSKPETNFYKLVLSETAPTSKSSSYSADGGSPSKWFKKKPSSVDTLNEVALNKEFRKIANDPMIRDNNTNARVFLSIYRMSDAELNDKIPKLLLKEQITFLEPLIKEIQDKKKKG